MSAAREETRARPAVVVRRVGPEAAEQVMHVVHEAFSARPPLDPPPGALKETVHTIRGKLADGCLDVLALARIPVIGAPLARHVERVVGGDVEKSCLEGNNSTF